MKTVHELKINDYLYYVGDGREIRPIRVTKIEISDNSEIVVVRTTRDSNIQFDNTHNIRSINMSEQYYTDKIEANKHVYNCMLEERDRRHKNLNDDMMKFGAFCETISTFSLKNQLEQPKK